MKAVIVLIIIKRQKNSHFVKTKRIRNRKKQILENNEPTHQIGFHCPTRRELR